MDLSNKQAAEYWFRRAEEVTDPDLRKEALAAYRKYRNMALREERMRLRRQKPGYGVRSMIGWIVSLALIVLVVLLGLSKTFSVVTVCVVFGVAIGLCLVAAAVTLRVYGHISEDAMLAMIQAGLKRIAAFDTTKPVIDATTPPGQRETVPSNHQLDATKPKILPEDTQR